MNFSTDSRKISSGMTYIAIAGAKLDGHNFISDAIKRGAVKIVHSLPLENKTDGIEYIKVPDTRKYYNLKCQEFYNKPDQKLKLIGITGTNGKTTTVYILNYLLNALNRKNGLISTIEYDTLSEKTPATHTTPSPDIFFNLLANMVENGAKSVSMEVSSHALEQQRIDGVEFELAIFSNLTGDHLDYHGNMESYFNAKKRLFTDLLAPNGVAIINIDDLYGQKLFATAKTTKISFGVSTKALVQIQKIVLSSESSQFELKINKKIHSIKTNLLGEYNISNLTAAILATNHFGIPLETIIPYCATIPPIPGRLEKVTSPEGLTFFVDYAHTDDALAKALTCLRPLCKGNLWVIFGCGGDRDHSKRPRMGAVAGNFADKIILTSDNPRNEKPEQIITDIESGISTRMSYIIEVDRTKAILQARKMAKKSDIILVAGKGHEDYQEIDGKKYSLNDRLVIKEKMI